MAVEEEEGGGGDIPEWVVTFGDMMSLLLTFFIMLVSMSEIKQEEKFQAMMESFRQQFGHADSFDSLVPGDIRTRTHSMREHIHAMGRAKKKDTKNGGAEAKAVTGDNDRVQTVRPGDDSSVGGVIYFAEDETELNEQNKLALQQIVEQVIGKPQKIEIRGHCMRKAQDKNANGQDAWDLTFARCKATMKMLVELNIDPQRIRLGSAAGWETALHRSRSRTPAAEFTRADTDVG